MKYLGNQRGWRELATTCLRHAVKSGDTECINNKIFSVLCSLANQDEKDVIDDLIFADRMKKIYGIKWYKIYAEKMEKLYGKDWYRRIGK